MAGDKIDEGDKVAWNWGAGAPGGKAAKVSEQEDVTMETKRGNVVKKKGEPGNPAVYVERSGHDAVKKASELQVEEKASWKKQAGSQSGGGAGGSSKKKASESANGSKQSAKQSANGVKKRQSTKANSGNARTRRSSRIAAKSQ